MTEQIQLVQAIGNKLNIDISDSQAQTVLNDINHKNLINHAYYHIHNIFKTVSDKYLIFTINSENNEHIATKFYQYLDIFFKIIPIILEIIPVFLGKKSYNIPIVLEKCLHFYIILTCKKITIISL